MRERRHPGHRVPLFCFMDIQETIMVKVTNNRHELIAAKEAADIKKAEAAVKKASAAKKGKAAPKKKKK